MQNNVMPGVYRLGASDQCGKVGLSDHRGGGCRDLPGYLMNSVPMKV